MTSATEAKTILIHGCGIKREGKAAAIVRPGHLLALDAALLVIPHGEAGQEAESAWAVEYDLTGRGITQNYAIGDQVMYHVLPEGSRVNALIVANTNIALNAKLSSNGDGTLKVAAATDFVVAIARQAIVGAVGVVPRCVVEVYRARGIA
jgi:anaerobic selenocysteine-containing dehydrogenase